MRGPKATARAGDTLPCLPGSPGATRRCLVLVPISPRGSPASASPIRYPQEPLTWPNVVSRKRTATQPRSAWLGAHSPRGQARGLEPRPMLRAQAPASLHPAVLECIEKSLWKRSSGRDWAWGQQALPGVQAACTGGVEKELRSEHRAAVEAPQTQGGCSGSRGCSCAESGDPPEREEVT